MTTLTTLKDKYERAVANYVAGYNNHEKRSKLKTLKSTAASAIKEYNSAREMELYREWQAEGDPVRTAVRKLKENKGIRVSYRIDDDTDVMSAKFSDCDIKVSLPMMHYTLGSGVFNSPDWFAKVEKFAFLYADYLSQSLGTASFEYSIRDISKAFNFPDGADLVTPEGIVKVMQIVFDSILYIENPDVPGTNIITPRSIVTNGYGKQIPAWTYIEHCVTRHDDKNGGILLSNTGAFSYIILETMHMIMTNAGFKLTAEDEFVIPNKDDAEDAAKGGFALDEDKVIKVDIKEAKPAKKSKAKKASK